MPTVRPDRLGIPRRLRSLHGHARGPGAEMRDTLKLKQKTRLKLAMNLRVRKPRSVVQKEVAEITV